MGLTRKSLLKLGVGINGIKLSGFAEELLVDVHHGRPAADDIGRVEATPDEGVEGQLGGRGLVKLLFKAGGAGTRARGFHG